MLQPPENQHQPDYCPSEPEHLPAYLYSILPPSAYWCALEPPQFPHLSRLLAFLLFRSNVAVGLSLQGTLTSGAYRTRKLIASPAQ